MKIQSVHMKNFRCFSDLTVNFDDNLTVLVGANGSGKTAVLDAVAYIMRIISGRIVNPSAYGNSFSMLDAKFGEKEGFISFKIVTEPKLRSPTGENYLTFSYNLYRSNDSFMDGSFSGTILQQLDGIRKLYAVDSSNKRPILVYYNSKRTLNSYSGPTNEHPGLKSAYESAFEPTIDFSTSFSWFINQSNIEAREWKKRGMGEYNRPELSAVRHAIASALSKVDGHSDEFDEPYVDDRDKLVICRKSAPDAPLSVEQLSDGYRVMLALVMDLARRMAAANENVKWPEGQTVLHSPAVVLIDEVEKHLHPGWQQTVLPKLMEIFPNTQFIVTTHSPQVLSSISSKHVRVLKGEKVYGLADVDETEGAESSRILRDVLGISPRPQDNKYAQKLDKYKALVYDEKWDTPEAEDLHRELVAHFHDAEPEMDALKLHIENSQWERQLEAEERGAKA